MTHVYVASNHICQQGIYFGAVHCTFFWIFESICLNPWQTCTLKSTLGSLILISLLNWNVKMCAGKTYNILYEKGIIWQTLPKSQRTRGVSALTKVIFLVHITSSQTLWPGSHQSSLNNISEWVSQWITEKDRTKNHNGYFKIVLKKSR